LITQLESNIDSMVDANQGFTHAYMRTGELINIGHFLQV